MELDFLNFVAVIAGVTGIAFEVEKVVQWAKNLILRPVYNRYFPNKKGVYHFTIHATGFAVAAGTTWVTGFPFWEMLGAPPVDWWVNPVTVGVLAFSGAQQAYARLEAFRLIFDPGYQPTPAAAADDGAVG